ncbi:PEP-CTERM sorting domain-containing protein [Dapis sp. BLCC M126]|uniref:PEP-CTERM sorting domain-containing protein n=1 Tax=Dapis sp. BLCC M126 TaxID=3400189 RepID=UPI003CFB106B
MLKKTLFAAATTITVVGSSLPAFANVPIPGGGSGGTQRVPEPMSVIGLIAFGGGSLLAVKRGESHKKAK